MKKRGISPLIATVLIIGFTIVLAAVYDRVLTDEEITNHYDTTKPL